MSSVELDLPKPGWKTTIKSEHGSLSNLAFAAAEIPLQSVEVLALIVDALFARELTLPTETVVEFIFSLLDFFATGVLFVAFEFELISLLFSEALLPALLFPALLLPEFSFDMDSLFGCPLAELFEELLFSFFFGAVLGESFPLSLAITVLCPRVMAAITIAIKRMPREDLFMAKAYLKKKRMLF